MVGKTLDGRFRIVEKLGAGGMGTVYKAVQAPLERLVALKVLNANYDSKRDPGFQRRFFLEASVTSKLKHPNTITVIDYGKTADNIYYIAMEYVEGITLAQLLSLEGTMPWDRCLNVAQQICRSLREAHRAGIIHRDLKPANVMICNEETDHDLVKVLDFGLVKSFQVDGSGPLAKESGELTQAGVFLGSPQYMAPEQARNLADPRSDIYSLGVVMYQMLVGRPPFMAEQSIDIIVKHMKEAPAPLSAVRPDLQVPPEVEALVMRCLEKDPAQRFQTMDEVLEGMRRASSGAGISGLFSAPRNIVGGMGNTPPPMRQPGQSSPNLKPPTGPQVAYQTPPSGTQKSPSGAHVARPPTGPHLKPPSGFYSRPAGAEVDVDMGSAARSQSMFAAPPAPSGTRKLIPVAIFLGSALLGLAVVWLLTREEKPLPGAQPGAAAVATPVPPPTTSPAPTPTPPPPPPPPKPSPDHVTALATVKFKITSEPEGAQVTVDGHELGPTPLEFSRPPAADGNATAQLTFTMDGFQTTTVTAAGVGPEVVVEQKLKKKQAPPPPGNRRKTTPAPGYKDDPYN
jgi:serine/threonine-protein kinase